MRYRKHMQYYSNIPWSIDPIIQRQAWITFCCCWCSILPRRLRPQLTVFQSFFNRFSIVFQFSPAPPTTTRKARKARTTWASSPCRCKPHRCRCTPRCIALGRKPRKPVNRVCFFGCSRWLFQPMILCFDHCCLFDQ